MLLSLQSRKDEIQRRAFRLLQHRVLFDTFRLLLLWTDVTLIPNVKLTRYCKRANRSPQGARSRFGFVDSLKKYLGPFMSLCSLPAVSQYSDRHIISSLPSLYHIVNHSLTKPSLSVRLVVKNYLAVFFTIVTLLWTTLHSAFSFRPECPAASFCRSPSVVVRFDVVRVSGCHVSMNDREEAADVRSPTVSAMLIIHLHQPCLCQHPLSDPCKLRVQVTG